jgi:hypothetical protein
MVKVNRDEESNRIIGVAEVDEALEMTQEAAAFLVDCIEGANNDLMPIDTTFIKPEVPIIDDLNRSDYLAVYWDDEICLRVKKDGAIQVSADSGKTWSICDAGAVDASDFTEWLRKYDPIPDGVSRREMLNQLEDGAEVKHAVISPGKEMYFVIGVDGAQIELVQSEKLESVLIDAQRLMITAERTNPFTVSEKTLRSFYGLLAASNVLSKASAEQEFSMMAGQEIFKVTR